MMNKKTLFAAFALAAVAPLMVSPRAMAQIDGDPDLVAKRGEGVITLDTFNAAAHRIDEDKRFPTLRNRERMETLLDQLLTASQLAADAEAAGLHEDPVVQARMALAAQEELAKAWIQNYIEQAKPADYTAMAREEWQLNRDRYVTAHMVDVSHILIGTDERSDEEALAQAENLHQQLEQDPGRFDELVMAWSDDPSKAGNKGRFTDIKKGQMVPEFEEIAFSLELGEISGPVKTAYGYHLVRKDGDTPSRQRKFREVRVGLEQQMKKRHLERVQEEYLRTLFNEELVVTQESMENAIERVFGAEVLAKYAEESESQ